VTSNIVTDLDVTNVFIKWHGPWHLVCELLTWLIPFSPCQFIRTTKSNLFYLAGPSVHIRIEPSFGAIVSIPYWKEYRTVQLEVVYRNNFCLFCSFSFTTKVRQPISILQLEIFLILNLMKTLSKKLNKVSKLVFIAINNISFKICLSFRDNKHFFTPFPWKLFDSNGAWYAIIFWNPFTLRFFNHHEENQPSPLIQAVINILFFFSTWWFST
jgi:hypothetical protein